MAYKRSMAQRFSAWKLNKSIKKQKKKDAKLRKSRVSRKNRKISDQIPF